MLHLAPLQLSSCSITRGRQYKSQSLQEDSFDVELKLMMDTIKTQRSKSKFPHNGYLYVFDKSTKDGNKKMWRCDQKNRGCKARLHTDSTTDVVVKETGVHIHGSDAAGVAVAAVITGMKRRAADTQEGIYHIYHFYHLFITFYNKKIYPFLYTHFYKKHKIEFRSKVSAKEKNTNIRTFQEQSNLN